VTHATKVIEFGGTRLKQFKLMQVTYELTQRDFLDSFIAHRNRSLLSKLAFRVIPLLVFLLAALGVVTVLFRPGHQRLSSVAPGIILAALWGLFLWGAPWWSARNQFLKQPSAHGLKTLMADEAGVHWRWDGGAADIAWRNIIRYLEVKNQFLLYTSPACFNIVPKRALAPEQLPEFRSLLGEHISATKGREKVGL
jgi:hypothetical protein